MGGGVHGGASAGSVVWFLLLHVVNRRIVTLGLIGSDQVGIGHGQCTPNVLPYCFGGDYSYYCICSTAFGGTGQQTLQSLQSRAWKKHLLLSGPKGEDSENQRSIVFLCMVCNAEFI